MENNIEAIAFDIDGTLLNEQHEISILNKKIIKQLVDKGIMIILATGRSYLSTQKYRTELDLTGPIICYNGATIIDSINDAVIYDIKLNNNIINTLIQIALENNVGLNLLGGNDWYIDKITEYSTLYSKTSGLNYKIIDFNNTNQLSLNKVIFIESELKLQQIEKIIENKLGNNIYKVYSKPNFLEVLTLGVSKGNALSEIFKLYNINKLNAIAFGDADNDLEMFNYVKYSVAMGNANDKVKNKAKYVCKSNNDDGIAHWLIDYFSLSKT